MKKKDYMAALMAELQKYPPEFREEILETFEAHFTEGEARGVPEDRLVAELGDIRDVIAEVQRLSLEEGASAQPRPAARPEPGPRTSPEAQQKQAGETWGFADPAPLLTIQSTDSAVDVFLKPGEKLEYRLEPSSGLNILILGARFRFGSREPKLTVETDAEQVRLRVEEGGGTLYVTVPSGVREVRAELGSGDLEVRELDLDSFAGSTRSGDIRLFRCRTRELDLLSASGDVLAEAMDSLNARIGTSSGDLDLRGVRGELELHTASGDIGLRDHSGGSLKAESASGDIELETREAVSAASASGDVTLHLGDESRGAAGETVSGDVLCHVRGLDFSAVLNSRTGDLENRTSLPEYRTRHELRLGEGRGKIALNSVSGDVTIQEG